MEHFTDPELVTEWLSRNGIQVRCCNMLAGFFSEAPH